MILSVSNIHKSFNEIPVLANVSFHIEDYDKTAIVGINGAGKTTLLRIIMGEISADEGLVTVSRDKTIGYLSQHEAVSGENTIYDELLSVKQEIIALEQRMRSVELQMKTASEDVLSGLMDTYADLTHAFESANGYAYKSELTGVLKGLGFTEEEFKRSVSTLSGAASWTSGAFTWTTSRGFASVCTCTSAGFTASASAVSGCTGICSAAASVIISPAPAVSTGATPVSA